MDDKIKELESDIKILEDARRVAIKRFDVSSYYFDNKITALKEKIVKLSMPDLPECEIILVDNVKIGDTLFIDNTFNKVKYVSHEYDIATRKTITLTFEDNIFYTVGSKRMVVRILE